MEAAEEITDDAAAAAVAVAAAAAIVAAEAVAVMIGEDDKVGSSVELGLSVEAMTVGVTVVSCEF